MTPPNPPHSAAHPGIRARAYAKINLCLAVSPPEPAGGPRAGWHRIASWFAPIDLWDDVHLEPAGSTSYERSWADNAPKPSPIDWPEDKDLAVRAHRLLEAHAGRPLPVRLTMRKRTPTGGGMGGGSSDAAAVLRGLTALFELPLTARDLRTLSARLGSDIAYFIPDAGDLAAPPPAALVRGFGDDIRPSRSPRMPITLILPEFGCPTPAVYKAFDAPPARRFRDAEVQALADPGNAAPLADDALFNDLLEPAIAVAPGMAAVLAHLRGQGLTPHLSGSGSTMFILGHPPIQPPPGCAMVRTRIL